MNATPVKREHDKSQIVSCFTLYAGCVLKLKLLQRACISETLLVGRYVNRLTLTLGPVLADIECALLLTSSESGCLIKCSDSLRF